MQQEPHTSVTDEMRDCIVECINCHSVCTETIRHCLEMGGEHANPNHITLLQDCAEICQTSGDFMLRASELHPRTCEICAEACECCAEDCESFKDDEKMLQCAVACRSCAASCREMAKGS
jgi:hypothetical protein